MAKEMKMFQDKIRIKQQNEGRTREWDEEKEGVSM